MTVRPLVALCGSLVLMTGIAVMVISCRPNPTTEPAEQVSPKALIKSYRDLSIQQADANYTGRKVRLSFGAKEYEVREGQICFFSGMPGSEPVLVCEHGGGLADNTRAIDVVGRCVGRVEDGKQRGAGVNWVVKVIECSVWAK
jgi:hypothetical protein